MRWRLATLAAIAALLGLAALVFGRRSPPPPQAPKRLAAPAPRLQLPGGALPPSVSAAPGLPPGALGSAGAVFAPGAITVSPPGGGPELRWSVDGASDAPPEPEDPLPGVEHYFLGNDPSRWRTDVPRHASAGYRRLRPGLDVKATPQKNGLTLTVTATAQALRDTWFRWEGPARAAVEAPDQVALATPRGTLTQTLEGPVRLAETRIGPGGGVAYRLESNGPLASGTGTFQLGLAWSALLTTALSNAADTTPAINDVHVAPDGTVVVVGETLSNSTIIGGSSIDGGNRQGQDAYVVKYSTSGTLLWGAYLGGTSSEDGEDVAFDQAGNVYVTGRTASANFPTVRPSQAASGGYDVFVTILTPSGNGILWSTYLGGGNDESALTIGVAPTTGNIWLAGYTSSANFPLKSPFDAVNTNTAGYPSNDGFLSEFAPDGGLLFSSFFGGDAGGTELYDLAFDPGGDVYAVGDSRSAGIDYGVATPPVLQPFFAGAVDGVILRVPAANPSTPSYFSYFGGDAGTTINSVVVDGTGAVYLGGESSSRVFPLDGGLGNAHAGGNDAFVSKLRIGVGGGLEWSSLFGDTLYDEVRNLALDPDGALWLTGRTQAASIPGFDGGQHGAAATFDTFAARLNPSGTSFDYAAFIGGNGNEDGRGIAVDNRGNVYVAGDTTSTDFPIANGGTKDGFLIKLDTSPPDGGAVLDGPFMGTDLDYQSGTASLSANWSPFTDPDSTSIRYELALGSTSGGAELTGGVFVDAGTNTSLTVATSPLADGQTCYATVHAINAAGLVSLDVTSDGIKIDTTPPPDGGVRDGPDAGTDLQYQRAGDPIAANWDPMVDPGSGIDHYEWAIGTTLIANIQGFTDAGLALAASSQYLGTPGVTYYVAVKAVNGAGLPTVVRSNGVLVDGTPPGAGNVLDGPTMGVDRAVQPRNEPLAATWSGFTDPESGIGHYEWALGTSAGATDVMGFTDVGQNPGAISSVLPTPNTTYYVTVVAFNRAGASSTPVSSNGVRALAIDGDPCNVPGDCLSNVCRNMRCLPPGTEVLLDFSRDGGAPAHFGERVELSADVTSLNADQVGLRLVMAADGLALANPDGGEATCDQGRTVPLPLVPAGQTISAPVPAYVCRAPGENPATLSGYLEDADGGVLTPDASLSISVDREKVPVGCDCASAPGMAAVAALLWTLGRRRRTG